MTHVERDDWVGMWATVPTERRTVIITGVNKSMVRWTDPGHPQRWGYSPIASTTPLFDLPRAWTPSGEPVPREHVLAAANVIQSLPDERIDADNLVDEGRLRPDLPEANDPTAAFVPDGKGWLLDGPTGPVVWTVPGGQIMIQRIEPGELTPEKAREFITHILAAVYHSENGCPKQSEES